MAYNGVGGWTGWVRGSVGAVVWEQCARDVPGEQSVDLFWLEKGTRPSLTVRNCGNACVIWV